MLRLQRKVPVWWAASLVTFTSPPYKSRHSDPLMVFCCSPSALQSLSQFGWGRFSLVAISFYAVSLLFVSCHLTEFTLAGPLYWPSFMNLCPWLNFSWSLLSAAHAAKSLFDHLIWPTVSASKSWKESKFNRLLLSQIKMDTSSLLPDMTQKEELTRKNKKPKQGCFRSVIARWFTCDVRYAAFYAPGKATHGGPGLEPRACCILCCQNIYFCLLRGFIHADITIFWSWMSKFRKKKRKLLAFVFPCTEQKIRHNRTDLIKCMPFSRELVPKFGTPFLIRL